MMSSNLITKARNILVEIHMRSSQKIIVGKIIDFDQIFLEVMVMVNEKDGGFASERSAFDTGTEGWREDRVLVNISDISVIA